jgi:hypothetical protein
MPIFTEAASYTRELEPKPLAYVASLTVAPLRAQTRFPQRRRVALGRNADGAGETALQMRAAHADVVGEFVERRRGLGRFQEAARLREPFGLRIEVRVVRAAALAGAKTGRPRGRRIREEADVAFERAAALTGWAAKHARGRHGVQEDAVEGRVALTEGVVVAAVHEPMMLATATSTPPESCASIPRAARVG